MSFYVSVPREMAARKPPHGSQCNQCGACCYATLCPLGVHVFGERLGPCPALVRDHEVDGAPWTCGLVLEPMRWATRRSILHGWQAMRAAALLLIGAGMGCDARFNGEPGNEEFYKKFRIFDRVNKDAVAKARKLWGV